ncbi:type IV secretory system conjugative DNA transfer family protein [Fusobacterium varium]|uniref:type IV secretory system conjugative DNA transfer family protein n=1 Tax=Fusobacterium varium TaxID=856 RepID=UPI001F1731AB|nr:type IV secretory system conjugative DNA transfer family protein [Fusobacterium varium]MCF2673638.1 type IV secretory system conjugative DNA transfer family protein [Fusobacterium varium]MCI6033651.1 type IV secretory system conjugative DNA transfer family protein [Fusobacterium varium]MDY4004980.1 type IV secretory system conjugative DNA transfer family protein [Fusobacterium varium]
MKKATKKKISAVVFISSFFFALWGATQTFAKYTGYAKGLGSPLMVVKGIPVYPPHKYLEWGKFKNKAPIAYQKSSSNFFMGIMLGMFLTGAINYKKKKNTSHGSSEWATKDDIDEMGFFPYKETGLIIKKKPYEKDYKYSGTLELYQKNILKNETINKELRELEYKKDGVFVGRDKWGRDLIDNSSGHIMMIAKTGGGKGVSVVLTTLWTWKGSTLVNDIKGENWQYTAAYRRNALGHKVFRFQATADGVTSVSCKYNPLVEIRKGTVFEYQDARLIAETIISPKKDQDNFFGPSAVTFLTGVILHVLYLKQGKVASLADVYRFVTSPDSSEEEKLEQMKAGTHNLNEKESLFDEIYGEIITIDGTEYPRTHPIASRVGADMLGRAANERSGIIGSSKTELAIFIIPTIARNTSESDFRINDLMNAKVPMDLYFVTPPNAVNVTSTLLKLFMNQIVFVLTNNMDINDKGENIAYKHRLLFLMDELPAIGRVQLFHDAISYIRGYGMKALIIIQDMKQLKATYGENNSFLGNMTTSIYYSTNDVDTAQYIEKRIGNETVPVVTPSYRGGTFFPTKNYTTSYVRKPLMPAADVHNMDENTSIILKAGAKPIKGKLAKWYEDEAFKNRFKRYPKLGDNAKSDKIR